MKVCTICGARYRGNPASCPLDGGELLELPDPLIGRNIAGRYVIQERIGQGGMGTVYRARHEVVGRNVALKFLSSELAHRPEHRTRFLREAHAANRINHEHIIDITDFGETHDGLVYLVMEFLNGVPLRQQIAQRDLDVARSLRIALQLSQALGRAHELGVIHRDIKPENIYLLSGHGTDFVKLLDFGLAQMKGELRVTATGAVFGTPEYIAPEQARGAPLTPACDLYALGCVLFEMLTHQLPFQGSTPELLLAHVRTPAPAPSSRLAGIPPEVDALVLRLLEKQPEARYPSAYALAREIGEMLAGLTAATPGSSSIVEEELVSAPRVAGPVAKVTDDHAGMNAIISSWSRRLDVLEDLSQRAEVEAPVPPWLDEHLARMRARVATMAASNGRLAAQAAALTEEEYKVRERCLQIGRALDALGVDEAGAAQRMEKHALAVGRARLHLEQAEVAWRGLRAELLAQASTLPEAALSEAQLALLVQVGQLAKRQLDAKQGMEANRRELQRARAEHEDIRFQMSQLKGRMGSFSAGAEVEISPAREELAALESELRDALDHVLSDAEPVVRHLMSYPHLRDRIRAASDPAPG